jgi:hypothetical protein
MHRRLLALVLLACALVFAACGGDDDVDVDQVLQQTFGEDKDIKSGRLDAALRLDARGLASLQGPVGLRLAGPFESLGADQLPRFDFEADLNAGGQSIRAGAVSTGEKGFVTFQGQAYALSDELYKQFKDGYTEQARSDDSKEEGLSFKALGIDPRRWLSDPQYEGKEDVGGTETLKIRAGIDVPRLLEDVNRILARAPQVEGQPRARELTEEERQQIGDAIEDARIELWTGEEDKILRRLNVLLDFRVPEERREQARGLTSGRLTFDLTLGDINGEQEFEEPENARPFEELVGGTGAPQPGAPSGSAYERCVQEAGDDIAKLQECAGA